MRSATFRNIALGILALAAAYHLGARSAGAQAPANSVVGIAGQGGGIHGFLAITANGDSYQTDDFGIHWTAYGNCFASGPTPATRETFGDLKSLYRPQGAAQPQDR